MSKLTNRLNLPQALVKAVEKVQGDYSGGSSYVSASGILTPPKIFHLKRRHRHNITEDVSDVIWSLVGTLMHSLLEAGGENEKDVVVEERLFKDVLGVKFSGQLDHYSILEKVLTDWKFVSVWSVTNDPKEEYIAQANCLRLLLHGAGYEVDELRLCYLIRDWSRMKASVDKSYPQAQVQLVSLPVWSLGDTEKFLIERIKLLLSYEDTPDDSIPICTKEERWNDGDVWAVMRKGSKRAVKLYDNELDARVHVHKVKDGFLELREGTDKRCLNYCSCNLMCNHYKEKYGDKDESRPN